jgi:hypothetical protein
VDELVVNAVNTSMPTLIDAETLAEVLAGRRDPRPFLGHVDSFFGEVPAEAAEAFVAAHVIPYAAVLRAHALVRPRIGEARADIDEWLAAVAGPPR